MVRSKQGMPAKISMDQDKATLAAHGFLESMNTRLIGLTNGCKASVGLLKRICQINTDCLCRRYVQYRMRASFDSSSVEQKLTVMPMQCRHWCQRRRKGCEGLACARILLHKLNVMTRLSVSEDEASIAQTRVAWDVSPFPRDTSLG